MNTNTQEILEKLFKAADNHGEDAGEPDHTVGDLQDVLREAWSIMSMAQKRQLLRSEAVEQVTDLGARGEFEPQALVSVLDGMVRQMETDISAHGYEIVEGEGGFFWENSEEASEDFHARDDAVESAYADLRKSRERDR